MRSRGVRVVGVGPIGDVDDGDQVLVVVDPVAHSIGAPARLVLACQRFAQRLADTVGGFPERAVTERPDGGRDPFGEALGECASGGRPESQVVEIRHAVRRERDAMIAAISSRPVTSPAST
ncbi:MAG: hypothetical protein ACRDSN_00550, partial [Pseudonocardiaceae bacterium]